MKISSSNVNLHATSENVNFSYKKFQLSFVYKDENRDNFNYSLHLKNSYLRLDVGEISLDNENDATDVKTKILKILIEKLTGIKIKTISIQEILNPENIDNLSVPEFATVLNYEKLEFKSQKVDFQAYGVIKTKSGEEIRFQIAFTLNKEQLKYSKIDIKAGSVALIDPLIINLNGDLENIFTDSRFEFDLDNDGKKEKIPYLTEGNGFIVFDKNENGKIDNGTELFGVITGDGFQELKKFDTDKDGWVDEDDKYFSRLKVWLKNENKDVIVPIKDLGIGAIYLSSVYTDFSFENKGFLRKSSIYLKEDNNVGIVSKVDFVV